MITTMKEWLKIKNIKIFMLRYNGRKIWAFCNMPGINNKGERSNNFQLLLYSSSGNNAESDSTWPIAGIYDEKAGDDPMNLFIKSFFTIPKINGEIIDGWIAKSHRDRNGLKSYMNSEQIKEICLLFEQVSKGNITDIEYTEVNYNQWRSIVNGNIKTTIYKPYEA